MQNQQGFFPHQQITGSRSRARESAENHIQPNRLGQCEQLRRAVDCAPYLNSAFFRPCGKNADVWSRAPLPTQQNFFEQGNIAEASGPCGCVTIIVLWRAALLAAGLSATGTVALLWADWRAAILARS